MKTVTYYVLYRVDMQHSSYYFTCDEAASIIAGINESHYTTIEVKDVLGFNPINDVREWAKDNLTYNQYIDNFPSEWVKYETTLKGMKVGQKAYTTHWAFTYSYTASPRIAGTVSSVVKKISETEYVIDDKIVEITK